MYKDKWDIAIGEGLNSMWEIISMKGPYTVTIITLSSTSHAETNRYTTCHEHNHKCKPFFVDAVQT